MLVLLYYDFKLLSFCEPTCLCTTNWAAGGEVQLTDHDCSKSHDHDQAVSDCINHTVVSVQVCEHNTYMSEQGFCAYVPESYSFAFNGYICTPAGGSAGVLSRMLFAERR